MNGPFDRKRIPSHPPEPRRGLATDPVSPPVGRGPGDIDGQPLGRGRRAELEQVPGGARGPLRPQAGRSSVRARGRRSPSKKMVIVPSREDPRGPERERRLAKLLGSRGARRRHEGCGGLRPCRVRLPDGAGGPAQAPRPRRDDRVRAALEGLGRLLERRASPTPHAFSKPGFDASKTTPTTPTSATLASSVRKQLLPRPGR